MQENGPTTEGRFVEQVRRLRTEKELTQRELSERVARLGVALDPTAITRIEKGKRSLKLDEAIAIASALDRSLEDVLREMGDPAAQLRDLRDRANRYLDDARTSAWAFAHAVVRVREALEENPSLMHVPAAEYVPWVIARLSPQGEDGILHLYEPDPTYFAQLEELVNHLLDYVRVVNAEEPEYLFDDEEEDEVSSLKDSDGEHQETA